MSRVVFSRSIALQHISYIDSQYMIIIHCLCVVVNLLAITGWSPTFLSVVKQAQQEIIIKKSIISYTLFLFFYRTTGQRTLYRRRKCKFLFHIYIEIELNWKTDKKLLNKYKEKEKKCKVLCVRRCIHGVCTPEGQTLLFFCYFWLVFELYLFWFVFANFFPLHISYLNKMFK